LGVALLDVQRGFVLEHLTDRADREARRSSGTA
jgi:hypothetical protein